MDKKDYMERRYKIDSNIRETSRTLNIINTVAAIICFILVSIFKILPFVEIADATPLYVIIFAMYTISEIGVVLVHSKINHLITSKQLLEIAQIVKERQLEDENNT